MATSLYFPWLLSMAVAALLSNTCMVKLTRATLSMRILTMVLPTMVAGVAAAAADATGGGGLGRVHPAGAAAR